MYIIYLVKKRKRKRRRLLYLIVGAAQVKIKKITKGQSEITSE